MKPITPGVGFAHLTYLDGLRGVLALYVVAHHFVGLAASPDLPPVLRLAIRPFDFGHAAVNLFIVLSGYSLMLPVTRSGTLRGGFLGYMTRRARRILPPYYAALALSIAVVGVVLWVEWPEPRAASPDDLSAVSVVSHLLLVHTWVPGQWGTINVPLWSVATEWHIYFLFPTVLLPVWRRLGSAGAVATGFALGLAPLALVPPGTDLGQTCPWYLGLFALGLFGAVASTRPANRFGRWWVTGTAAAAVVGYVGLKWLLPGSDGVAPWGLQWLKDSACGVVGMCLLVGCSRSLLGGERPRWWAVAARRALETRFAAALGRFSYSLYCTHWAVLTAVVCVIGQLELSPAAALAVRTAVGIPLAVLIGYLFSRVAERPFLASPSDGRGSATPPY